MKVVVIIPARGGSKGIPRKNVKPLAGKPLIAYPIEAARGCSMVDRVIVSTEDAEIAETARRAGAEIIVRPGELAADNVATLPVLVHAVQELGKCSYVPDIIVLLYATAPFIKASYIEDAVKKLVAGADAAVSVCEDTRNYKLWNANGKPLFKKRVNRQSATKAFRENGALYAMTYGTLMKKNSITGGKTELIFMSPEESVDINEPLDFIVAEALMKNRR